ncbi:HIT family protein [Pontibacter toksunensis]|uniref:HIT family protein n=1 Tax=Pontibacter toksunensis TaxID=1332631 RepID=A0ABW6C2P4_9BACT
METSIFTKIVNGEIPAYKIAEDDRYLAFLDVFPTTKGHTLVIPKQQINYLFDLEDDLYLGLMAFAKKVAVAVEKAVPCKRIGVAVVGLEVPHAHVHLIPLNSMQDMNFANKQKFTKEEFEETAEKIKAAYKG